MNWKYWLGCIILFLGLLWLLLPHAYHHTVSDAIGIDDEIHWLHILEGVIGTLLGLWLVVISQPKH